jgi:hypothetical protein
LWQLQLPQWSAYVLDDGGIADQFLAGARNVYLPKSTQTSSAAHSSLNFFINVYMVLFLFNTVILCIFIVTSMYSYCMFMYDYPDWGFFMLFSQL